MYQTHLAISQDAIQSFCEHYPIRKLSLFGSVLRDDFGPNSDVDVLIEFEPESGITYLDLVTMQDELAAMMGRRVDVLTPGALSQHFRQRVLDTARMIYERG